MSTSINTSEIPVSTVQSATAASYTVAADRYAIVRGQVKNGGTLSIGGVVVLSSDTWSVVANNVSPRTIRMGGAGFKSISVPLTSNQTAISSYIPNAGNLFVDQIRTSSSSYTDDGDAFTNSTARTSDSGTFKVPAGTVIVGSGDARYHIELYRIPGSAT